MRAETPTRRAWLVWGTAALVYLAAVFHRGTLGVAGPTALERFHVGPAALSTFTVLQLSIYAAMQIPTGILVDRFGPRRILTAAVILLGCGQILFAFAVGYPHGLLARAILGVGDAMTWVSVLRLVAAHFPARLYPLVVTFSSTMGAIGGVTATFPLAITLENLGWTNTFLLVGAITLAYATVAATLVRDTPPHTDSHPRPPSGSPSELLHGLRRAWAAAGTRLAFWVHFSTMFVANALSLLWGYPYLVMGLGMDPGPAGVVLSTLIIGQIIGGPLVGTAIGRRPEHRMPLVLSYLLVAASLLATLTAWPHGQPPLPVVIIAFAIFAFGGPVSATAFALTRDYNSTSNVGTATGVANTAGHSATAVAVLLMGLVLQLVPADTGASAYRLALLPLLALLVLGFARTTTWWRRARAHVLAAQARGEDVPVAIRRRPWDLTAPAAGDRQ